MIPTIKKALFFNFFLEIEEIITILAATLG